MRTIFKLIVVVAMMATTHLAWASYTFTMKLDISGSCGGWSSVERSTAQALFDRYVNSVNLGIPSRAECEQARQIIMSEINGIGSGSCKIRVVCGPCTGSGGMGDAPGVNLEGPSKGGSFYSGNASSEIRDWDKQNNALKQMLSGNSTNALPQNTWTASVYKNADSWIADGKGSQEKEFASNARNSKASGFVIDTSKEFGGIPQDMELVPLPAQKEKVSRWVSQVTDNEMDLLLSYPDKCEQTFQSLFREKTGIDINAIIQKPYFELTDDERQALGNYNEFLRQTVGELQTFAKKEKAAIDNDERKKMVDLVILAEDSYYDSEHSFIDKTDYRLLTNYNISENDPIKNIFNLVEDYNSHDWVNLGFHASIYKNDVTGEYTVAFEGTDDISAKGLLELERGHILDGEGKRLLQDGVTDLANYLGFDTRQYSAALAIGQAIALLPEGCNVNITGHSLGGGLASIAGLVSGAHTVTVNAAGVSDKLIEKYGLKDVVEKKDYDITAIVATGINGDVLDKAQYVGKKLETSTEMVFPGMKVFNIDVADQAIGNRKELEGAGGWHSSKPVVEKMLSNYSSIQKRWQEKNNVSLIDSMMRTQLLKGENYERDN